MATVAAGSAAASSAAASARRRSGRLRRPSSSARAPSVAVPSAPSFSSPPVAEPAVYPSRRPPPSRIRPLRSRRPPVRAVCVRHALSARPSRTSIHGPVRPLRTSMRPPARPPVSGSSSPIAALPRFVAAVVHPSVAEPPSTHLVAVRGPPPVRPSEEPCICGSWSPGSSSLVRLLHGLRCLLQPRGLCLDKFAAAVGRITAAKGLLCSFFPPSFLSLLLLLPASILVCLCFCRVHPSLLLECLLLLLHLHHVNPSPIAHI